MNRIEKYKWLIGAAIVAIGATLGYFLGPSKAVFEISPAKTVQINTEYPGFSGGKLLLEGEGDKVEVFLEGSTSTTYRGIPKKMLGKTVRARLESDYWKLSTDNIVLNKSTVLDLIPNGKLGLIHGMIVDQSGRAVSQALIRMGSDTLWYSNSAGQFNAQISYALQKENQLLVISKNGYVPVQLNHTPGRSTIVQMIRVPQGNSTIVVKQEKETIPEMFARKGIEDLSDRMRRF